MEVAELFYQRRTVKQILWEGAKFYASHLPCLTRPLIWPILAQILGVVIWLGLTYGGMNWISGQWPSLTVWALWMLFILLNAPGMLLFFYGFWRYMVWYAALNLLIREVWDTGRSDDPERHVIRITNRSSDYTLLWTFLFALLFIPFGFAMIPISLVSAFPDWLWVAILASIGILLLGYLVSCISLILFSLVFQVFAYMPGSAGATLFRSVDLVGQNILKTIGFIVIVGLLTQFILPGILTTVLDVTQLTRLIAMPTEKLVQFVLQESSSNLTILAQNNPVITRLVHLLWHDVHQVSVELVRTLLFSLIYALLLPLGTVWFALLYADLKMQQDARRTEKAASL